MGLIRRLRYPIGCFIQWFNLTGAYFCGSLTPSCLWQCLESRPDTIWLCDQTILYLGVYHTCIWDYTQFLYHLEAISKNIISLFYLTHNFWNENIDSSTNRTNLTALIRQYYFQIIINQNKVERNLYLKGSFIWVRLGLKKNYNAEKKIAKWRLKSSLKVKLKYQHFHRITQLHYWPQFKYYVTLNSF